MSYETWRAEFYPIDAERCPKDQAIQHSLRKWEGLRPENLERHGLTLTDLHSVAENGDTKLGIDSESCALCIHYHLYEYEREVELEDDEYCLTCPLAIVRGDFPCDHKTQDEEHGPWQEWMRSANPEPMIFWLKKTLEEAA